MDFLKNWIMGICGCTVLISVICALVPKTSTARLLRVCGMILMIFSVFAPLKTIRAEDIYIETEQGTWQSTDDVMTMTEEFEISIIEERMREYILQRANQLDIDCEVNVSVEKDDNGILLPNTIEVYGAEEMKELEATIERECGIKPTIIGRGGEDHIR